MKSQSNKSKNRSSALVLSSGRGDRMTLTSISANICTILMHVHLLSFLVLLNATEIRGEVDPKWALWYSEDFSTPLNDAAVTLGSRQLQRTL
jgi:hypothetical protein